MCVCGTKSKLDEGQKRKSKEDGSRKREGKKSKRPKTKLSKRKESPREASRTNSIDESARKSPDERQFEKKIAGRILANGETVNYPDDFSKESQADADPRVVATRMVDDAPSDIWCSRIDDREDLEEDSLHDEDLASSADEPGLTTRGIDYDKDVVLHSRCASMCTDDEDEKRVKCAPDEEGRDDEEEDPDESTSAVSGEPEDPFWTSEVEDKKPEANRAAQSVDRKLVERTSSRIHFSNDARESSRKTRAKEVHLRRVLPPIKRTFRNSCVDNETRGGSKGTSKLDTKATALLFREQSEIRRKLNSCSFEVRSLADEERVGKARTQPEGSLIPRLASPPLRQGANFAKSDGDQSEIAQNGTSSRASPSGLLIVRKLESALRPVHSLFLYWAK